MPRPVRDVRVVPPAGAPPRVVYRCIEPFVTFRGGVPLVFSDGEEVLDDDPILLSCGRNFEPVSDRVLRRTGRRVEQATAAPGELRHTTTVRPDTTGA